MFLCPSGRLKELGLIRKPASFMTSICDERGQELIYAGMPITEVFKSELGLGGTLGLLWFQRRSAVFQTVGRPSERTDALFMINIV